MYCNHCGNLLTENAQFCAFCGAKCGLASVIPARGADTSVTEAKSEAAPDISTAVPENVSHAQSAPSPEMISAAPAASAPIYHEPAPQSAGMPAQQGTPAAEPSAAMAETAPAAQGIAVEIPIQPEKVKVEKYYTLGHIMLCLGAVAIMAIVAGVFAGLYFSVI